MSGMGTDTRWVIGSLAAATAGAILFFKLRALEREKNRKTEFVVGSRKSNLAMIQTNSVVAALKEKFPEFTFRIENMETLGDKVLDVALSKIGTKSLFTKELEVLLLGEEIDFAVHSLKDLPTSLPEGLKVGAICEREDPRDAVIFRKDKRILQSLSELPTGSVVGTSSLRRTAQLSCLYPDLIFESVRGNLNTRIRKLDESRDNGPEGARYSALVLAAAGIVRMGWKARIGEYLDPGDCPYAVSQGALGIECRAQDEDTSKLLEALNHHATALRCQTERSFMRQLEGGCSVPIGVTTDIGPDDKLVATGAIHSLDGSQSAKGQVEAIVTSSEGAEQLGVNLAEVLSSRGAREILAAIPRQDETPTTKPSSK